MTHLALEPLRNLYNIITYSLFRLLSFPWRIQNALSKLKNKRERGTSQTCSNTSPIQAPTTGPVMMGSWRHCDLGEKVTYLSPSLPSEAPECRTELPNRCACRKRRNDIRLSPNSLLTLTLHHGGAGETSGVPRTCGCRQPQPFSPLCRKDTH